MSQPKQPDEIDLWMAVSTGARPRDAAICLDISRNRTRYLCEKWGRQGIYDWGVCVDIGWLT